MRTIRDEYEMPDEGDDYDPLGSRLRHRNWRPLRLIFTGLFLVLVIAATAGLIHLTNEQQNDAFCASCHTVPEVTYRDRSSAAVAGALAVDLSSSHYQQIRGQGETLRCIDCHQGNGSLGHRIDTVTLSARNALAWLGGRNNQKIEKLYLSAPHLSNTGCVNCHQKTLLLAGKDNHHHNMLPPAYDLWHDGGSLIAPEGVVDRQAIITAGLVRYDTKLMCSDCHQSHRTIETDFYLDKTSVLPAKCVQCHREVDQGPLQVSVP
jgi:hypothetical protein